MAKFVRCANPTCHLKLFVAEDATDSQVRQLLFVNGWTLLPDPELDDKPMPFCPVCTS